MYTYMYISIGICICICTCTYRCMCMYISIWLCICVCTYIYIYIPIYTCMYVPARECRLLFYCTRNLRIQFPCFCQQLGFWVACESASDRALNAREAPAWQVRVSSWCGDHCAWLVQLSTSLSAGERNNAFVDVHVYPLCLCNCDLTEWSRNKMTMSVLLWDGFCRVNNRVQMQKGVNMTNLHVLAGLLLVRMYSVFAVSECSPFPYPWQNLVCFPVSECSPFP